LRRGATKGSRNGNAGKPSPRHLHYRALAALSAQRAATTSAANSAGLGNINGGPAAKGSLRWLTAYVQGFYYEHT
jgi:hypothetical protein